MALQNFVDRQGPVVSAAWLNEIDAFKESSITIGSFIPALRGSTVAGSNTYTTRTGQYIKMGRLVYVNIVIILSAKDGAMAGNVEVSNLPFPALVTASIPMALAVSQYNFITFTAGNTQLLFRIDNETDTSSASLLQSGSNQGATFIPAASIANDSVIFASGTYISAT